MPRRGAGVVYVALLLAASHVLAAGEESCATAVGRRIVSDDGETLELVQVVVVHRHGDRTPIAKHAGIFSQTPDLEAFWATRISSRSEIDRWGRLNVDETATHLAQTASDKYSYPNGHLTVLGANQLRRVGAELRERYIGDLSFLPNDLPALHSTSAAPNLVYARSTRIPRTIQSVQNLLLGLYPEDQRPSDIDGRQAKIIINSLDKASDPMTGINEKRCPKIKDVIVQADVGLQVPSNYSDLLDRLSPVVGTSTKQNEGLAGAKSNLIDRWVHLGDIATCHMAHRIEMPLNLSSHDLTNVQKYNGWIWGLRLVSNKALNGLAIGGFIKDVVQVFADTVAGVSVPGISAPKMAVFSGHDSTLFPLLTALGAFDGSWPPYASRVQIELLRVVKEGASDKDAADYRVQLIYNGRSASLCQHSPGLPVRYQDFVTHLNQFIVSDMAAACAVDA